MLHTASATAATATTFSPCSQPAACSPMFWRVSAKITMRIADGSVNPSHAAKAPGIPARSKPIESPSFELAAPGRNCESATRSAYVDSSTQPRRCTYSARK